LCREKIESEGVTVFQEKKKELIYIHKTAAPKRQEKPDHEQKRVNMCPIQKSSVKNVRTLAVTFWIMGLMGEVGRMNITKILLFTSQRRPRRQPWRGDHPEPS